MNIFFIKPINIATPTLALPKYKMHNSTSKPKII